MTGLSMVSEKNGTLERMVPYKNEFGDRITKTMFQISFDMEIQTVSFWARLRNSIIDNKFLHKAFMRP